MDKQRLILAVGLPGSGKSTWIDNNLQGCEVLGVDRLLQAWYPTLPYDEAYALPTAVECARQTSRRRAQQLFDAGRSVVIDQTNLTMIGRLCWLRMASFNCQRIALVFPPHPAGPGNRPGKTIPTEVYQRMSTSYERPAPFEGFHHIVDISPDWNPR